MGKPLLPPLVYNNTLECWPVWGISHSYHKDTQANLYPKKDFRSQSSSQYPFPTHISLHWQSPETRGMRDGFPNSKTRARTILGDACVFLHELSGVLNPGGK